MSSVLGQSEQPRCAWASVLADCRGAELARGVGSEPVVDALYRPLLGARPSDRPYVIGHIAQSLDGRIASTEGSSRWISGAEDLEHTHRLRALCDAVLVGVTTANIDNPRLTVRRVDGPDPLRVVLDTQLRCDPSGHLCSDGQAPTLIFCAEHRRPASGRLGQAEVVGLPQFGEGLDPAAVLSVLAGRGIERILVEGGGVTLSRFLSARCMDRLHVLVAPLLLGEGPLSFHQPGNDSLADGLRPSVRPFVMGGDVLFDCGFGG